MEKNYDVIIVGAGPCGYFAAYELTKLNKDLKVLLVDKGFDIYHRSCPVLKGKIKQCPQDIYGKSEHVKKMKNEKYKHNNPLFLKIMKLNLK